MNNHLDNGTVLPHGLLGLDAMSSVTAFNRAYKNTPIRMGIILKSYTYNDPNNYTKLTTEYDVVVLEQNENVSCTNIVYRNCISSEGMGSVADFFEKNLRYQTQNNNTGGEINTAGQNGAIVTLFCLDAFTQKAVILGGLTHPDRQTKLKSSAPQLYGEYNGVAVAVNPDGSTSLVFNGATDNNGNLVTPGQGPTTVQISTDGSFSVQNAGVTMQLQNNGAINVNCSGEASINSTGTININSNGAANIVAQSTVTIDGPSIKLGASAIQAVIKGNEFAAIFDSHTHSGVTSGPDESGPPAQPMDSSLSTSVFTK